jgi:uncharacterized protein (TIGR03000 family)
MLRTGLVLVAFVLVAATGTAQPRPLPLAPGVTPGSPFAPGAPFQVPAPPPPRVSQSSIQFVPVLGPGGLYYPWVGYASGLGYGTGYGFGYPGMLPGPAALAPAAPVVVGPVFVPDVVNLANEFPATLTLQFPAAAQVWLDGKKLTGSAAEERVLTSPVLRTGEKYTFNVKARWEKGGKTYEAKRAVALGAGDRSRLSIISGDEVRE